jgi:hypothetical protein
MDRRTAGGTCGERWMVGYASILSLKAIPYSKKRSEGLLGVRGLISSRDRATAQVIQRRGGTPSGRNTAEVTCPFGPATFPRRSSFRDWPEANDSRSTG